jgi:hypothetical protein
MFLDPLSAGPFFSWPSCSAFSSFRAVSSIRLGQLFQQPVRARQRQDLSFTRRARSATAAASSSAAGSGLFFLAVISSSVVLSRQRELMLARIAALIAVDAPPAFYLANAGAAADSGVTADDSQAVMIGIAPVVGTPRVVAAGGNILAALGFEIMVAEA